MLNEIDMIGGTTSVSVSVHGLYCQYICMLQVYIYVTLPVHLLLHQVNLLYTLQISPAPIRVGEGEPPPSWDPVPTPKGTKLLVSLLLVL
jgi:hypothetical protein